MAETFDYIIVGAGSAGCVVANRLSADPRNKVLLLEAGPSDRNFLLHMPAAFSMTAHRRRFEWGYSCEREPAVLDRRFSCPRGRVLGGSSAINAMCFVRGHAQDFDDWASSGLTEWSYAHCLPYFRKLETFSNGEDEYRGATGPLNVTAPTYSNSLNEVFLSAAEQAGFRRLADTNGADQEGFGPVDQTIHNGRRVTTATAYLTPVRQRPNLAIRTGITVKRILMDGSRAMGVECKQRDKDVTLHASGEIVLSAGAINSPQILMLSGIGPARHLQDLNIPVMADRPEVGRNLQDHLDVSVRVECLQPVSVMPTLRRPRKLLAGLQWLLRKSGAAATNHFEAAGYVRTQQGLRQPNIQLLFIPLLVSPEGTHYPYAHGYQATVMPLRPKSRGAVTLNGADPMAPPRLNFNYLNDPEDLPELRGGVQCLRQIFAQPAFDAYRGQEIGPGAHVTENEELDAYILQQVKPNYHPCGTCRMGADEAAIVDPHGCVRGCSGLRVIDASIFPSITSGNINAPTIMLAEKLSDAILHGAFQSPAGKPS